MAAPVYPSIFELDLEDDRILIDIETSYKLADLRRRKLGAGVFMERILHHLREGRTLGPISILLILLVYSLLSPLLPPMVHEYIYHILH